MRVCIGGTFNILHKGHKLLFKTGLEAAGENGHLFIGISEGTLLKNKKYKKPFEIRKNQIEKFLNNFENKPRIIIKKIFDFYGLTLEMDFDAIVVSDETLENAIEINEKRIQNNKKPMKIIKIPLIVDEKGKRISSTRILNKEIDENGCFIE